MEPDGYERTAVGIPLTPIGRWADAESVRQKSVHFMLSRLMAIIGVTATATSLIGVPGKRILLSIQLTAMALLNLWSLKSEVEKNWYNLRALAESVKTVEWRVIVGVMNADPLEIRQRIGELRDQFLPEISEHRRVLAPRMSADSIDDLIRRSQLSFEARRDIYRDFRIKDQLEWYGSKARFHSTRWWRLKSVSTTLLFLVLVMAISGTFIDSVVPVLLALVTVATVENSAAQNASVASAYTAAENELGEILLVIDDVQESAWIQFVNDAEESISREHVSWRASHGISAIRKRAK